MEAALADADADDAADAADVDDLDFGASHVVDSAHHVGYSDLRP